MAGQYYYDPRPYYGVNTHSGLMPLDEVFYGKYDPVPYWMDQRMAPVSFDDGYFPTQKQMMYMPRRPEMQQYIQREDNLMAYKRPEVRDDLYTDMYRRPQQMMRPEVRDDMYTDMYRRPQQMMRPEVRDDMYMDYHKRPMHLNGALGGYGAYPEMRQLRGQSQDDTWLHTMTPVGAKSQSKSTARGLQPQGMMVRNGPEQFRQVEEPMGYMPSRNNGGDQYQNIGMPMGPSSNGRKSGEDQYMTRQMEMPVNQMTSSTVNYGGDQHRQMEMLMSNKSNNGNSNNDNKQMNLPRNQSGNGYNSVNKGYEGYEHSNGKSQGPGGKSMRSSGNQGNTNQRAFSRTNDSSDDDDDDEYENGNHGTKRSSNNSHYHQGEKQQLLRNKFDSQNYGSEKTGLKSKSGKPSSNQGYGNNHVGQNQSKTSQKLYQDTWDSSSDDDEGFTYTKKASKGQHMLSTTKVQQSGHGHGNKQHSSFQDHSHQAKQTQYGSNQSKCVELKVPICCDNCERKVRNALEYMDGVESVLCDQWSRKVIVYGNVKPDVVLKKVRRVKKTAELWQQSKQQLQQVRLY